MEKLQTVIENYHAQENEIVILSNQIAEVTQRITSKSKNLHAKKMDEEMLKNKVQEKQKVK